MNPVITKNGHKYWYDSDGELHREDGPAMETIDGTKAWCFHGQFHRKNGPAIEFSDGHIQWLVHGKLHREDGPAAEWPDRCKMWSLNDKAHREDGPALELGNGDVYYCLENICYSEEEYLEKIKELKPLTLRDG